MRKKGESGLPCLEGGRDAGMPGFFIMESEEGHIFLEGHLPPQERG